MPQATTRTETPYRASGALSPITAGYNDSGLVGYCVEVQAHGFGGLMTAVVGVNTNGEVTGVAITSHSETAGVGTRRLDAATIWTSIRASRAPSAPRGQLGGHRLRRHRHLRRPSPPVSTRPWPLWPIWIRKGRRLCGRRSVSPLPSAGNGGGRAMTAVYLAGWLWPPCCRKILFWSTVWVSAPAPRPFSTPGRRPHRRGPDGGDDPHGASSPGWPDQLLTTLPWVTTRPWCLPWWDRLVVAGLR